MLEMVKCELAGRSFSFLLFFPNPEGYVLMTDWTSFVFHVR
jgi:hypothetical protein